MTSRINVLQALMIDEGDVSENITLIHNESKWGHRFTRGRIPVYESVRDFHKHTLSLSSLSLKGFKPMTRQHSSHLLPLFERDYHQRWMYGLLGSLADFRDDGDTMYFEKMYEYGLTGSSVKLENGEMRRNGRKLIQMLHEVGSSQSNLKLPNLSVRAKRSPHPETFLSIAERERGLREEEGWDRYFGMEISNEGRTQKDDFRDAENIEKCVVESAFMSKDLTGDEVEWGTPLIPKLLDQLGLNRSSAARSSLSKRLVYLSVDILKVAVALESIAAAQNLLGENYRLTEFGQLESLRFKFGLFLECLIPGMTYTVFCSTVKYQELLSRIQVANLLSKARNSRRIIFKLVRERILGKKKDVPAINLNVTCETTMEELRVLAESSMMGGGESCVTFELSEAKAIQKNVMDVTVVDEILRDEGEHLMHNGVNGSVGDATLRREEALEVHEGLDNLVTEAADSVGVAEVIGMADGGDEGGLSFAGAGIFLEERLDALRLGQNAIDEEEENDRLRQINEEEGFGEEGAVEDLNPLHEILREESTSTPTVQRQSSSSESHSSGSGPFSSTKIEMRGKKAKRIGIGNVSPIRNNAGFFGRSRRVAPVESWEESFREYIENEKEKLKQDEMTKLLNYYTQPPVGVDKSTWHKVAEVVGDALLNGKFMIQTSVPNRAAAAVLIAKYMCRLSSGHKEEGLGGMTKKEFDDLMKTEGKLIPIKITSSKLKFMKEKLRPGDSRWYLELILGVLYPAELQVQSALNILELCK